MDRNSIIGILLIGAVLIGWSYFSSPSQEEIEAARHKRDSIAQIEKQKQIQQQEEDLKKSIEMKSQSSIDKVEALPADSVSKKLVSKFGPFASAAQGNNEVVTLENEFLEIKIHTLGGRPYSVHLKDYQTYDSLPLKLFDGDSTMFGFNWIANNAQVPIRTQNMFFTVQENVQTDSAQHLVLRMNAGDDKYVDFKYILKKNDYTMDFKVDLHNLGDVVKNDYLAFDWSLYMPSMEKGHSWEMNNSSIYYRFAGDDVEYLSETSDDQKRIKDRVKWIAFKQQFFSSILVAKEPFVDIDLKTSTVSNHDFVKHVAAKAYLPYMAQRVNDYEFTFYFGPNKFSRLESYDNKFEELIPLGWGIFGWVNMYMTIPLFDWLGGFISNFGVIILILTFIIKLGLFPLTYKSFKSTAKMRVLKPEVDEIGKKFPKKEDAMKKQQATMALYKKAGASPMGGCLPMLLQLPFLIALFRFFPASIELRQESFLWADDLSSYDSVLDLPFNIPMYGDHVSLFVLLMTIVNFIYISMNNKNNPQSASMPGMKTMMYIMPLFMLFFFNSYASALSYYYLVSLTITILQTWIFRKMIDDDALRAQLNENKKKPVKKSKFQQRMEDMQKRQQTMQNQKKKK
ncbi:MAG: membrane protein insertase YidC [Salinivirgaceae bacterium]|nr:MAG: membrane protein insertase YidC [Salinivirgaceae bacterium]